MSSASELALSGVLAASLALVACDAGRSDNVALTSPPPIEQPVGPVPGPTVDAGVPRNPFGRDPMAIRDGRVYFLRYNCAGCHGDHAGGGMGPSLRDRDWIYGGSDVEIYSTISEGRAHGMPAWGVKLPSDVVWKLVAYVRSLRTPDEPSPPDQTTPAPPAIP